MPGCASSSVQNPLCLAFPGTRTPPPSRAPFLTACLLTGLWWARVIGSFLEDIHFPGKVTGYTLSQLYLSVVNCLMAETVRWPVLAITSSALYKFFPTCDFVFPPNIPLSCVQWTLFLLLLFLCELNEVFLVSEVQLISLLHFL